MYFIRIPIQALLLALSTTKVATLPQTPGFGNPWNHIEEPFDPWAAQHQPEQLPKDPFEDIPCAPLDFKIDRVVKYQCMMRPLLYVPELQACVPAFTEKYCSPGQWLVPDSSFNNNRGTCEPNICPEAIATTPMSPFFTFASNGDCYTTNTTAYCRNNQRLAFSKNIYDGRFKSPDCRDAFFLSEDCQPPAPASFMTRGNLRCQPGLVMTRFGCSVPSMF